MKMRDVFELPLIDAEVDNNDGWDDEQYEAAAHAINMHDKLVNAVDVMLNRPELANHRAISELLTRAKGGCDE